MGIFRSSLLICLIIMKWHALAMEDNSRAPRLYAEPYVKAVKQASKEALNQGRQESAQLIQFLQKQQETTMQLYENEREISKHLKEELDKTRSENTQLQHLVTEAQELVQAVLDETSLKEAAPQLSKLKELLGFLNQVAPAPQK